MAEMHKDVVKIVTDIKIIREFKIMTKKLKAKKYTKTLEWFFSIKNSEDRIYKIITIFGIRIKLLRIKILKKQFKEQRDLLNQSNLKKINFADFINRCVDEPKGLYAIDTNYENSNIYDKNFYDSQAKESYHSAQIVVNILQKYYKPTSVFDLGCGVGTWLKAWQDLGVEEILGVDANEMPEDALYIPRKNLKILDFENIKEDVNLGRFDLAMTLECFEHIAIDKCDLAIDVLTNTSDLIMFSAAIPYQCGTHHINCHRLQFWVEKFKNRGYKCYDIIRPECLQKNLDVEPWYLQNILVFAKNDKADILEKNGAVSIESPVMFYHADMLRDILIGL